MAAVNRPAQTTNQISRPVVPHERRRPVPPGTSPLTRASDRPSASSGPRLGRDIRFATRLSRSSSRSRLGDVAFCVSGRGFGGSHRRRAVQAPMAATAASRFRAWARGPGRPQAPATRPASRMRLPGRTTWRRSRPGAAPSEQSRRQTPAEAALDHEPAASEKPPAQGVSPNLSARPILAIRPRSIGKGSWISTRLAGSPT